MSTTLAPNGLRPSNLIGGQSDSSSTRMYKMKANDTGPIFYGDPVIIVSSGSDRGLIQRFNTTTTTTTVTAAATMIGVFLGCKYTDPVSLRPEWKQFYPGSINASDIYAFVLDDPDALFEVQADATIAQTRLGCNASLIQTAANSTATGSSGVALQASSVASTATLPLRIVDFVQSPDNAVGDTYTRVIVRLNTHALRTTTGTAAS